MLIFSCRYYGRRDSFKYGLINFIYLVILGIFLAVSSIYNIEGLRNTTIVYIVLWGLEKYTEFYFSVIKNGWLFFFSFSVMAYFAALEIHKNP
jgi:hypothetical protein